MITENNFKCLIDSKVILLSGVWISITRYQINPFQSFHLHVDESGLAHCIEKFSKSIGKKLPKFKIFRSGGLQN